MIQAGCALTFLVFIGIPFLIFVILFTWAIHPIVGILTILLILFLGWVAIQGAS